MDKLIIIGCGGHGREILEFAMEINEISKQWEIMGFIDDNLDALAGKKASFPILGRVDNWKVEANQIFALGVAAPDVKAKIVAMLEPQHPRYAKIIHPLARISKLANIGRGFIAYPNAGVACDAVVGDFVTLLSSKIAHDVHIGNYSTISSHCGINGGSSLGEYVFIGSNASIIPGVSVEDHAYVGAGRIVIRDVPKGARVFGNPARQIL